MRAEELRHRITFQKLQSEISDNGFEIEAWIDFKTVWAKAANIHGKEYFEAAAVQKENTVKFLIRYTDGIDADMRILFKGKQYNITAIDNIRYANKFIEIKGVEVETDG